jgi:translation elongation factor EF-Ts
MITDSLVSSDQVAREMFQNHFTTYAQFSKAEHVKLGRKNYLWEITTIHLQGKIDVAELLLAAYVDNPHQTVEELLGDIQLILKESKNRLKLMAPRVYSCGTSIEKIMNQVEEAKNRRLNATISAVS